VRAKLLGQPALVLAAAHPVDAVGSEGYGDRDRVQTDRALRADDRRLGAGFELRGHGPPGIGDVVAERGGR
jgi:hypothetical protein